MTTTDHENDEISTELSQNLAKLDNLSQRLSAVFEEKKDANWTLNSPGNDLFVNSMQALWRSYSQDPAKIWSEQITYWNESLKQFVEFQKKMTLASDQSSKSQQTQDKRFEHPLWHNHPYFSFLKGQYFRNAETVRTALQNVEGLQETDERRLTYFVNQVIDMMAPTNFLATNPEALELAVQTKGQSLICGLENLISDLEANNGELVVRLADDDAFKLGVNIATTPGKVVFRNHLHELIQYTPSTETVFEKPLILFPPWINKFYILDLKDQNSLIRWLVGQGFSVFVVSWFNPDESYADIAMEDYIEHGFLRAIETAKSISRQNAVNTVGYCIGGTTLAMTLALLKKRNDKSVESATFFATLTDFSEQGEFLPFLQNDFIDGIDHEIEKTGILKSYIMARTFSFLRSNDLVYAPAIKSYMMGKAPPAFDLLFWNGDGTNLPGMMAHQYLRRLCQNNEFAKDGFDIFDEVLEISDVDVPLFAVGCETDHIAAWKDSYRGIKQMRSSSKTFILSQSGHIGGIINPPERKKHGYYTNTNLNQNSIKWKADAEFVKESWWSFWGGWLATRSGSTKSRLPVGSADFKPLCDAPGIYVSHKVLVKEK